MNKFVCFCLALLPLEVFGQSDTLRLTLDECITMARRQSIDAAVALGELRSAYWQWRSYRADLLPEVSLSGTLPSYNKRYSSYQQADGGLSFVRNDYLGLDGAVNITQKLWPTGGTLPWSHRSTICTSRAAAVQAISSCRCPSLSPSHSRSSA